METQTRLSRHNKFISADNIIAILSVSSDDSLHASLSYTAAKKAHTFYNALKYFKILKDGTLCFDHVSSEIIP